MYSGIKPSRRYCLEANGYTPALCGECNGWGVMAHYDERSLCYVDVRCAVCGGTGIRLEKVEKKTIRNRFSPIAMNEDSPLGETATTEDVVKSVGYSNADLEREKEINKCF